MALGTIKPGYMGIASIAGNKLRCNDFSMQAIQSPLFYDHIFGLRDSVAGGGADIFSGKSDTAALKPQKKIMRPSVKIYQGGISYPITGLSADPLFEYARTGDDFEVSVAYTCGIIRVFSACKINTYSFTATAGDICTVSADIIGVACADGAYDERYEEEEVLLTWDDISVSVDLGGSDDAIRAITFNVNNNCKPVYTAGGNITYSLDPVKIRVGMQEVNGSIEYYNKGVDLLYLESVETSSAITITGDGINMKLHVVFKPQERSSAVGPIISSLPFVGVDWALGE